MNNPSTVPPTIAVSHAMPVLNELEQRGYSQVDLFAELGIPAVKAGTNASDVLLSAADFSRLYGHACRLLEALTSGRQDHSSISKDARAMLCYCVITCRTLREAIKRAAIYCRVAGPVEGDILHLRENGRTATLIVEVPHKNHDTASLLVCLSTMNLLHQLFSWLTGRLLRLEMVALSYPDPLVPIVHGSLASQPLRWGAQYDALVFRVDDLALPVVRSVAELEQVIDYFPFDVQRCTGEIHTLSGRLRTLLTNALQSGLPPVCSVTAAQMLHMSSATLRRKLQKEGSSFKTVLRECQHGHALHLVQSTDTPIAEIATRIGYSDDRAFRRAFRSWTGYSPSDWRSQGQWRV
ncbi:MAG: AraC family transcriptional regulator ligand-binding domain-containing protein [Halioglobus sp.]|nr:AraC family transcriptional regulator ligand-binding domain-containing protein [Halioglobus sp.]